MKSPIPDARDINVFDSLDERAAVEHFLGLDRRAAEVLFRNNFLYYQEDLMFMGPAAFCYYVRAAADYLLDRRSEVNALEVENFCMILEHRSEHDFDRIAPACAFLRECVAEILRDLDRYDAEPAGVNRVELRARFERLLRRLA